MSGPVRGVRPGGDEEAGDAGSERLRVIDAGRLSYAAGLEMQRRYHGALLADRDRGAARVGDLLLLEHDPPVITVTRRPGAGRHVLADGARLRAAGVELAETDRGGDVTYHGPGQLVAYAVIDLNVLSLRLHNFVRTLESIVIDACAAWGVAAQRDACATGVWTAAPTAPPATGWSGKAGCSVRSIDASRMESSRPETAPGEGGGGATDCGTPALAKICAMGVRVSRWASMHGLALNVATNLSHFDLIVPCGLNRPVTSLQQILGSRCPTINQAKAELARCAREWLRPRSTGGVPHGD